MLIVFFISLQQTFKLIQVNNNNVIPLLVGLSCVNEFKNAARIASVGENNWNYEICRTLFLFESDCKAFTSTPRRD